MLSLSQVARYNQLRKQCYVRNDSVTTAIVPINALTCDSVKCNELPDLTLATETYIKWILDLPIHMCMVDRKRLAKSVAKVVCLHHNRLALQRETIKH